MKHLKTYENIQKEPPKLYDYVICDEEPLTDPNITEFVNSHIGQIIKILPKISKNVEYIVKFENVPKELKINYNMSGDYTVYTHGIRKIFSRELKDWNENKEELELKLNADKYNI